MYIVYVLQNTLSKEIYYSLTINLKRRLEGHNSGKNPSTNRNRGKWKLVYAEAYRNEKDARTREKKIKKSGKSRFDLKTESKIHF